MLWSIAILEFESKKNETKDAIVMDGDEEFQSIKFYLINNLSLSK